MYAIETAKMSSKGQMVIPDSLRKRYGWHAGISLLLIGTADALVVQSIPQPDERAVETAVAESRAAAGSVAARIDAAREGLAKLGKLGISLPVGIEDGDVRRNALAERHA